LHCKLSFVNVAAIKNRASALFEGIVFAC